MFVSFSVALIDLLLHFKIKTIMNSKLFTKTLELESYLTNWYCELIWNTNFFETKRFDYAEIFIYQHDYDFISDDDLDLLNELSKYGKFRIESNLKHGISIALTIVANKESEE